MVTIYLVKNQFSKKFVGRPEKIEAFATVGQFGIMMHRALTFHVGLTGEDEDLDRFCFQAAGVEEGDGEECDEAFYGFFHACCLFM
jgi:hypothetical protein